MNRFAAAHPEDWEAREEAMVDAAHQRADGLREEAPPKSWCVACGDECPAGSRWCSESCRQVEDGPWRDEVPEDAE